jgi:penicillin-binding protein 1C
MRQTVAYAGDIEPRREEWFVAGTESAMISAVEAPAGQARIVSPANGAVLALDPDIPALRQRVVVRVTGARPGASLRIDGGAPLPAGDPQMWMPTPGRHRLRLVDAGGAELDRVNVTVRGMR